MSVRIIRDYQNTSGMIHENLRGRRCIADVCGNRLLFVGNTASPVSALSHLCWDGSRRVADGIVRLAASDDLVDFSFANPDGTLDFCGNALLAICKVLEVAMVRVRAGQLDVIATADERRYSVTARFSVAVVPLAYGTYPGLLVGVGTPHYVVQCGDPSGFPLSEYGAQVTRDLRANLTVCGSVGSNILLARTFERGVEAETRACGTGAMAAHLAFGSLNSGRVVYPGGSYFIDASRTETAMNMTIAVDAASVRVTWDTEG